MIEKSELFGRLAGARGRNAIFLTTTSGLSITELGRNSGIGRCLAGTHFWNPPHLMPLVEVVRGEDTDDAVMDCVVGLIQSIGKVPVRVNRDVPGFVGNRLLHAMWREAINLVQRGIASPADVDLVARLTFGLRMPAVGPLENIDLVGLDLVQTIHRYLLADLADDRQPQRLLDEYVKSGRLGVKSGRGFYDWHARAANELVDRRNRQIIHQIEFLKKLGPL
jgi:3-hydroxybutyryl-CoA dehydrogenase